ncbi:MAG: hypothetical protein ACI4OR_02110 [Alphaproteobacteria bacterium]
MNKEEQEALDDLTRLFPTMACGEVQELKQYLIDARTLYEPRKTKKIRELLPSLERLKKQGVLFGYPLVADVISHLERVIQKSSSFSEPEFTLMHNDVLLLQDILWKKIKGDGGEKGAKILNQLVRFPK